MGNTLTFGISMILVYLAGDLETSSRLEKVGRYLRC